MTTKNEEVLTPFPNITELSPVTRPTIDLLRKIRNVQSSRNKKLLHDQYYKTRDFNQGETLEIGGDFCNGLILAADSMYRQTSEKNIYTKVP